MKVREIMTSKPATCSPGDSVASALQRLWEDDCGILPVIEGDQVVGIVTDRDLAMALLFQGARPTELSIGKLPRNEVHSCSPEDETRTALEVMAKHQVRRLPVVEDGRLVGVVSLNDVALEAHSTHGSLERPTYEEVAKAFQAICTHRQQPVTV
ncbi:MAG: CBS domain-containing protein [Acidobacteriota bacterium]|nr:CBS domain-containing protein [Acidobacteriota bacterium]